MGSPGRIGLSDIYLIFGKKTLHIYYPGLHFRHLGLNFITVGTGATACKRLVKNG